MHGIRRSGGLQTRRDVEANAISRRRCCVEEDDEDDHNGRGAVEIARRDERFGYRGGVREPRFLLRMPPSPEVESVTSAILTWTEGDVGAGSPRKT
jgi:hypothetical protein